MTLPDCITIEEPTPNYPVYVIQHEKAMAKVALHGAHLMEWIPTVSWPVIYLSPKAVYQEGKAIRGGIPICWPWFNAHPTDPEKPSHGVARTRFWTLVEAEANDENVRLVLVLESNDETRLLWPHDFKLRVEMTIGTTLNVSLETENTSDAAFEIEEAIHTYLRVDDIGFVTVRGLKDSDYLDTVGELTMKRQIGDIAISEEVDRQYASEKSILIEDALLSRDIEIVKNGSATTVVWNPWIEKTKRLSDMPETDFHEFLCIETANAGDAKVTVPAGEKHRMESLIRLR